MGELKKCLYIMVLGLVLPLVTTAKNDENSVIVDSIPFKNQIDLYVSPYSIGFGYSRKILRNWYTGINVGAGFSLVSFIERDISAYESLGIVEPRNGVLHGEIWHSKLVFKYYGTSKFKLDVEIGMASFSTAPIIVLELEKQPALILGGVGLGVYYGEKVQFGLRCFVGKRAIHESGFAFSMSWLLLRIPLVKI